MSGLAVPQSDTAPGKAKPSYYTVEVDDISDDETIESPSTAVPGQISRTCQDTTVPSRQLSKNIKPILIKNREPADKSTDLLVTIFDDLEKLWKDIETEKSKIEDFRHSLVSSKKSLHLGPGEDSSKCKDIDFQKQLKEEQPNNRQLEAVDDCYREHTLSRRKSTKPVRSAVKHDPNFRGVTVNMKTRVQGGDSKLIIDRTFTSRKPTRTPHVRNRRNSVGPAESPSSDSDDNTQYLIKQAVYFDKIPWRFSLGGKVCASCSTRKTPLWRDAEDGTPLCNACGIRYKKYRVRCSRCWHIPKKDGKSYPHCPCCGSLLSISYKRSW